MNAQPELKVVSGLKLDLGCGKRPMEGFEGVDAIDFGQKHVVDLRKPWPWEDGSVARVHCSHFIEHLTSAERCHFVNELYRVLEEGGEVTVIVPHWCSNRAYGDPTHVWPPVSEMWFFYLNKEWRDANAPHTDALLTCDFDFTCGYSMHQMLMPRNQEYQQHALSFWKEAAQDIVGTLKKRPATVPAT